MVCGVCVCVCVCTEADPVCRRAACALDYIIIINRARALHYVHVRFYIALLALCTVLYFRAMFRRLFLPYAVLRETVSNA